MGHRLGLKARAKLRIFRSVASSRDVWLFIDKVYGSVDQIVPNMPKLAQWWERYCKKNNLIPHEILRASIPAGNKYQVVGGLSPFFRVWNKNKIQYPTTNGGWFKKMC